MPPTQKRRLRRYLVEVDGVDYAIEAPENATVEEIGSILDKIVNTSEHRQLVEKMDLRGKALLRSALATGAKELAVSDNMSALGGAYFNPQGKFVLPQLGQKSLTQIVEESRARAAQDALNTWQTYAVNPIQPVLEALGYAKPDLRWKDPAFLREREKAAARMEELFGDIPTANEFEGNLVDWMVPGARRAREDMAASGVPELGFRAGLADVASAALSPQALIALLAMLGIGAAGGAAAMPALARTGALIGLGGVAADAFNTQLLQEQPGRYWGRLAGNIGLSLLDLPEYRYFFNKLRGKPTSPQEALLKQLSEYGITKEDLARAGLDVDSAARSMTKGGITREQLVEMGLMSPEDAAKANAAAAAATAAAAANDAGVSLPVAPPQRKTSAKFLPGDIVSLVTPGMFGEQRLLGLLGTPPPVKTPGDGFSILERPLSDTLRDVLRTVESGDPDTQLRGALSASRNRPSVLSPSRSVDVPAKYIQSSLKGQENTGSPETLRVPLDFLRRNRGVQLEASPEMQIRLAQKASKEKYLSDITETLRKETNMRLPEKDNVAWDGPGTYLRTLEDEDTPVWIRIPSEDAIDARARGYNVVNLTEKPPNSFDVRASSQINWKGPGYYSKDKKGNYAFKGKDIDRSNIEFLEKVARKEYEYLERPPSVVTLDDASNPSALYVPVVDPKNPSKFEFRRFDWKNLRQTAKPSEERAIKQTPVTTSRALVPSSPTPIPSSPTPKRRGFVRENVSPAAVPSMERLSFMLPGSHKKGSSFAPEVRRSQIIRPDQPEPVEGKSLVVPGKLEPEKPSSSFLTKRVLRPDEDLVRSGKSPESLVVASAGVRGKRDKGPIAEFLKSIKERVKEKTVEQQNQEEGGGQSTGVPFSRKRQPEDKDVEETYSVPPFYREADKEEDFWFEKAEDEVATQEPLSHAHARNMMKGIDDAHVVFRRIEYEKGKNHYLLNFYGKNDSDPRGRYFLRNQKDGTRDVYVFDEEENVWKKVVNSDRSASEKFVSLFYNENYLKRRAVYDKNNAIPFSRAPQESDVRLERIQSIPPYYRSPLEKDDFWFERAPDDVQEIPPLDHNRVKELVDDEGLSDLSTVIVENTNQKKDELKFGVVNVYSKGNIDDSRGRYLVEYTDDIRKPSAVYSYDETEKVWKKVTNRLHNVSENMFTTPEEVLFKTEKMDWGEPQNKATEPEPGTPPEKRVPEGYPDYHIKPDKDSDYIYEKADRELPEIPEEIDIDKTKTRYSVYRIAHSSDYELFRLYTQENDALKRVGTYYLDKKKNQVYVYDSAEKTWYGIKKKSETSRDPFDVVLKSFLDFKKNNQISDALYTNPVFIVSLQQRSPDYFLGRAFKIHPDDPSVLAFKSSGIKYYEFDPFRKKMAYGFTVYQDGYLFYAHYDGMRIDALIMMPSVKGKRASGRQFIPNTFYAAINIQDVEPVNGKIPFTDLEWREYDAAGAGYALIERQSSKTENKTANTGETFFQLGKTLFYGQSYPVSRIFDDPDSYSLKSIDKLISSDDFRFPGRGGEFSELLLSYVAPLKSPAEKVTQSHFILSDLKGKLNGKETVLHTYNFFDKDGKWRWVVAAREPETVEELFGKQNYFQLYWGKPKKGIDRVNSIRYEDIDWVEIASPSERDSFIYILGRYAEDKRIFPPSMEGSIGDLFLPDKFTGFRFENIPEEPNQPTINLVDDFQIDDEDGLRSAISQRIPPFIYKNKYYFTAPSENKLANQIVPYFRRPVVAGIKEIKQRIENKPFVVFSIVDNLNQGRGTRSQAYLFNFYNKEGNLHSRFLRLDESVRGTGGTRKVVFVYDEKSRQWRIVQRVDKKIEPNTTAAYEMGYRAFNEYLQHHVDAKTVFKDPRNVMEVLYDGKTPVLVPAAIAKLTRELTYTKEGESPSFLRNSFVKNRFYDSTTLPFLDDPLFEIKETIERPQHLKYGAFVEERKIKYGDETIFLYNLYNRNRKWSMSLLHFPERELLLFSPGTKAVDGKINVKEWKEYSFYREVWGEWNSILEDVREYDGVIEKSGEIKVEKARVEPPDRFVEEKSRPILEGQEEANIDSSTFFEVQKVKKIKENTEQSEFLKKIIKSPGTQKVRYSFYERLKSGGKGDYMDDPMRSLTKFISDMKEVIKEKGWKKEILSKNSPLLVNTIDRYAYKVTLHHSFYGSIISANDKDFYVYPANPYYFQKPLSGEFSGVIDRSEPFFEYFEAPGKNTIVIAHSPEDMSLEIMAYVGKKLVGFYDFKELKIQSIFPEKQGEWRVSLRNRELDPAEVYNYFQKLIENHPDGSKEIKTIYFEPLPNRFYYPRIELESEVDIENGIRKSVFINTRKKNDEGGSLAVVSWDELKNGKVANIEVFFPRKNLVLKGEKYRYYYDLIRRMKTENPEGSDVDLGTIQKEQNEGKYVRTGNYSLIKTLFDPEKAVVVGNEIGVFSSDNIVKEIREKIQRLGDVSKKKNKVYADKTEEKNIFVTNEEGKTGWILPWDPNHVYTIPSPGTRNVKRHLLDFVGENNYKEIISSYFRTEYPRFFKSGSSETLYPFVSVMNSKYGLKNLYVTFIDSTGQQKGRTISLGKENLKNILLEYISLYPSKEKISPGVTKLLESIPEDPSKITDADLKKFWTAFVRETKAIIPRMPAGNYEGFKVDGYTSTGDGKYFVLTTETGKSFRFGKTFDGKYVMNYVPENAFSVNVIFDDIEDLRNIWKELLSSHLGIKELASPLGPPQFVSRPGMKGGFLDLRLFGIDPSRKTYPRKRTFVSRRLPEIPEIEKILEHTMIDPPQMGHEELIKNFIYGGEHPLWHDRPGWQKLYDKIKFGFVDDMNHFVSVSERMMKNMEKKGIKISPANNPVFLARLHRGFSGKMLEVFRSGIPDPDDPRKTLTKGGFREIFEPLMEDGNQADYRHRLRYFGAYLLAKRSIERPEIRANLAGGGLSENDVEVARKAIEVLKQKDPETYALIQKAEERWNEWTRALMEYYTRKGRITEEERDRILAKNETYVPFNRVFEELLSDSPIYRTFGQMSQPLKDLKGSERIFANVFMELQRKTVAFIHEADRHEALLRFSDLLDEEGPVPLIGGEGDVGPFTFTVNKEGVKRTYYVTDPYVHYAITQLGQMEPDALIIWTRLSRLIRNIIVKSPSFVMRNLTNDLLQRAVYTKGSLVGQNTMSHREAFRQLSRTGGSQSSFEAEFPRDFERLMRRFWRDVKHGNERTRILHPVTLYELYDSGVHAAEQASRVLEYQAIMRDLKDVPNMTYREKAMIASLGSRDLIDFAIAGRYIRALNRLIPFTNAAVQSFIKMLREFRGAATDARRMATLLLRFGLLIAIPEAITAVYNNMDPKRRRKYRKLPDYRRDLFWNFQLPNGDWISIPKGHELSVIASGFRRLFEKDFSPKYLQSLENRVSPFHESIFLGPYAKYMEPFINFDFLVKEPIIPTYEAEKPLKRRRRWNTDRASWLSRVMGYGTNTDPRLVEKALTTWFGDWGKMVSDAGRVGHRLKDMRLRPGEPFKYTGFYYAPRKRRKVSPYVIRALQVD